MDDSAPITPRSLLSDSVRSVLNTWDGYQIAVLNNSGGAETYDKDKWYKYLL